VNIVSATDYIPYVDDNLLLNVIHKIETSGVTNSNARGDGGKAFGDFQIHQDYLDDVNRIASTSFTLEDMDDHVTARWAVCIYLSYYGENYKRKTGKIPSLIVYARIHNGGPNGYKKDVLTQDYVKKVQKIVSKKS
jgi:hypothetical protein